MDDNGGSGGGTRTPDTRIMIPPFFFDLIHNYSRMSRLCRRQKPRSIRLSIHQRAFRSIQFLRVISSRKQMAIATTRFSKDIARP